MADQVPREAKMASLLLSSSGIEECEPKVIQQLLEFMYRYVTDVLQESLVYAEHAGKSELDLDDLRLAIKSQLRHMFVQPPSREFLLELAARKNALPLPMFEEKAGLRLPPDQQTLLGASFRITSQRRPPPPPPPPPGYVPASNAQAHQRDHGADGDYSGAHSQPLSHSSQGGRKEKRAANR